MKKLLAGISLTVASLVLAIMTFLFIFNFLPSSTQDRISQFLNPASGETSVAYIEKEASNTFDETSFNEQITDSNEEVIVALEYNQEAELYYQEAETLWMKSAKEANRSLELLNKALDIDPNNIKYLRLKCDLLSDLGQDLAAIELGEKIIKQTPTPTTHDYWILAVSYERIGDSQKADLNYDKAIEVAEDGKTAAAYWIAKADIAHENNKYDTALQYYKQAAKADVSFTTAAEAMEHFYKIFGNPEQMLMYERTYLGYVKEKNSIVRDQSLANKMNNEISTLRSAVESGIKQVDGAFPAIYEAISRYGILGIDPYRINLVN